MGVLKGHGRPNIVAENGDSISSDEESFIIVNLEDFLPQQQTENQRSSEEEEGEVQEGPQPSRNVRPPRNATTAARSSNNNKRVRTISDGHRLTLKKGRRSKRRYEDEKSLFESNFPGGFSPENEEDFLLDILPESRSHFRELLTRKNLLEMFVNVEEGDVDGDGGRGGRHHRCEHPADPEEAFLRIGANLRVAMKKHLPWGMIEGLETDIRGFFSSNPEKEFSLPGLSSYERLLAHACSSYHNLQSKSYDSESGLRILKIENPLEIFNPIDPGLTDYLRIRCSTKNNNNNGGKLLAV